MSHSRSLIAAEYRYHQPISEVHLEKYSHDNTILFQTLNYSKMDFIKVASLSELPEAVVK
jgi:hypothetical protein